jgi:membrane glycosyltransferase
LNLHIFEHWISEAEDGSFDAWRRTLVDFKHATRCWVQAQLQHSPLQPWR